MNMDIHKQEEEELEQILQETFENTTYTDDDIHHLINGNSETYQEIFGSLSKRKESMQSHRSNSSARSRKSSSKESEEEKYDQSAHKEISDSNSVISSQEELSHSAKLEQSENKNIDEDNIDDSFQTQNENEIPECYQHFNRYLEEMEKTWDLNTIQNEYPFFMISQPKYNLGEQTEEEIFQYNTLKNVNIEVIDVGFCDIAQNFKIAVGTDDGRVAIFEKTYTKPVNIFEAFTHKKKTLDNENIKVLTIKWSENMQYLAVTSSSQELKVYQFKQEIQIEEKSILRMLKQPIELIAMGSKELKFPIIKFKFISEQPLLAIVQNENDEVSILSYSKKFLSKTASMNKLPITFHNTTTIAVTQFCVPTSSVENEGENVENNSFSQKNTEVIQKNKEIGTLLAVGTEEYITIALLYPKFEVIMVYDKYKHGKNIKKEGHPHLDFSTNGLTLLIVWDKFVQLLKMEIESLEPLIPKISSEGTLLLPETTLASGFLSPHLMYQATQSGIQIYSLLNLESNPKECPQVWHTFPLSFFSLPKGLILQEHLSIYNTPILETTTLLNNIICVKKRNLFICRNTSLQILRVKTFQEYIHNVIENLNDWKVGLQMLSDLYKHKITGFDNMTPKQIQREVKEYSKKYIHFLKMVISDLEDLLWKQELTFLINILLETNQCSHIFLEILPILHSYNLTMHMDVISPFVFLHRIPVLPAEKLSLLIDNLPRKIISTLLLGSLSPHENEIDFPHIVNTELIAKGMFLESVEINFRFGDWYTGLVVVISQLQNREHKNPKDKHLSVTEGENRGTEHTAENENHVLSQDITENQNQNIENKVSEIENEVYSEYTSLLSLLSFFTYKSLHLLNTLENPPSTFLSSLIPLLEGQIGVLMLEGGREFELFRYILPELFKGKCLWHLNTLANKTFNTDLMTDIVLSIPIDLLDNHTNYWIFIIKLYTQNLIKIDIWMGLRYLIKWVTENNNKESNKLTKLERREKKTNELQKQTEEVNKVLSELLSQCSNKMLNEFKSFSKEVLFEFYTELLSPKQIHTSYTLQLLRILALLLGPGNYIPVIHAILSNNESLSMIFPFVLETIDTYTEQERRELQAILYENLEKFIEIDCFNLCEVLFKYYLNELPKFTTYTGKSQNSESLSLENISPFCELVLPELPTSMLEFIKMCVDKVTSQEIQKLHYEMFELSGDFVLGLRLQYLRLLALTNHHSEILPEIKNKPYPIDQTLSLCRKYGVLDAEAYLLVKSGGHGDIEQAINLYFQLVEAKIPDLREETFHTFKGYFISIVEEVMLVCSSLHSSDLNTEWFTLASRLAELKVKIYRILPAHVCDLLVQVIDEDIYPQLVAEIVGKENVKEIIDFIGASLGITNLDLPFITKLVDEIIASNHFMKNLYLLAEESLIDDELNCRKLIHRETFKGFKCTGVCYLCHEHDNLIIHYNSCGHELHPSCGQDVKYCVICGCTEETIFWRQIDSINKIKIEVYGQEVDLGQLELELEQMKTQKSRNENIMEKLKKYDDFAPNDEVYF